MEGRLTVRIVLARCEHGGGAFGIRVEERRSGRWVADWAFSVAAQTATREGWGESEIAGEFTFSGGYPGCPWCEAKAIVQCGCGRVACWNGRATETVCPWCGDRAQIEGRITALKTGGDR